MPEMHLWDPKVKKHSACGPFTRHQQRIDMFMKDGRLSHILKNRLDPACFQHDSGINNKENLLVNSQLAEELHKPIIKNFNRRKVYSSFKDNI